MTQRAQWILVILSSRRAVRLTSPDEAEVFFEGSEGDALRVANVVTPMVGGDDYTFSDGFISKLDDKLIFKAEDAFDLDCRPRIVIGERKDFVTVEWLPE